MMATKKPEVAENGRTKTPINDTAKIIDESSAWDLGIGELNDDQVRTRIGEYFSLCASRGELPIFETLCLYLDISDEEGLEWSRGENCSQARKKMMQKALTRMKAIEAKASQKNMIPIANYIWRGKQYFGYREPDPKITLQSANPLKELPSAATVAEKYLVDVAETEAEEESRQ